MRPGVKVGYQAEIITRQRAAIRALTEALELGLEDYGNGIPRADSKYRSVIRAALAQAKDMK